MFPMPPYLLDMLNKVRKTIRKYGMLHGGDRVLVAVSGGVDSVALLHVLLELRKEYGIELLVCHLNHGLRGEESLRDERFVGTLAGRLGLPFLTRSLDAASVSGMEGEGLQEVARRLRYRFYEEVAEEEGGQSVAMGHNSDDQAETVLMRFLKGSGAAGLRGIPPVRGRYIRPLIEVSREEIEAYVKVNGIDHVEDSSNYKRDYLRNSIRHELLPFIEKRYNSGIRATLNRLASTISLDDDYIMGEADSAMERAVISRRGDRVVLDRVAMAEASEAVRSRIYIKLLSYLIENKARFSHTHLRSMSGMTIDGPPNISIDLPMGLKFVREYERVILGRRMEDWAPAFEDVLRIPGETRIEKAGVRLCATILDGIPDTFRGCGRFRAYFDLESLEMPVIVRGFRHGDRVVVLGMDGRRKVKDLFIDEKVPAGMRPMVPILVSGGEIIWVAGLRQSEKGKISQGTRTVLSVELSGRG